MAMDVQMSDIGTTGFQQMPPMQPPPPPAMPSQYAQHSQPMQPAQQPLRTGSYTAPPPGGVAQRAPGPSQAAEVHQQRLDLVQSLATATERPVKLQLLDTLIRLTACPASGPDGRLVSSRAADYMLTKLKLLDKLVPIIANAAGSTSQGITPDPPLLEKALTVLCACAWLAWEDRHKVSDCKLLTVYHTICCSFWCSSGVCNTLCPPC